MWMDVAHENSSYNDRETEARSDDEDTVYDRNSSEFPDYRVNPFNDNGNNAEFRGMLEEGDTRCGFLNWRPQFLQNFTTPMSFIGSFIIAGILHGASWSYFTSSISTMEKRFKMRSETTGALLAGNELAQLIISIALSYFAIRRKRLKFITFGASLWVLSCVLMVSLQMFFGSGKYALSMTKYEDNNNLIEEITATTINDNSEFTHIIPGVDSGLEDPVENSYSFKRVDRAKSTFQLCLRDVEFLNKSSTEECSIGESGSSFPVSFIFISQLLAGTGTMLFLSSGCPYTEDIILPHQLPILFSITLSLRLIGPFLGYIFGSAFLRVFISNVSSPAIDEYDPRWLGAYWIGWLVLALFMLLATVIIALFPAQMPALVLKKRSMTTDTGAALLSLNSAVVSINSAELRIANTLPLAQNFMNTLLVFFNNSINLFLTLSTIFHIFVAMGYWTFFPKYLEVVFHEAASKASIMTGSVTVTFNAAGLLVSGYFINKQLPSADRVSFWNILVTAFQIFVLILITQFGCDNGDMVFGHNSFPDATPTIPTSTFLYQDTTSIFSTPEINISTIETTTKLPPEIEDSENMSIPSSSRIRRTLVTLLSNCSRGCDCKLGPMNPLCDESTGQVFYDPCNAGCQKSVILDNKSVFKDCSCAKEGAILTKGFCSGHDDCYAGLVTLLIFTAMSQFFGSTGVIGRLLIFYRSTEQEGRSLVISLGILMVGVFAIIPGPIIFGTIFDSGCHIWESLNCSGRLGHCWHYNLTILRYGFNLAAAGFLFCGGIFDVMIWRKVKVKDVRLYDGEIDEPKPLEQPFEDMSNKTRGMSSSGY